MFGKLVFRLRISLVSSRSSKRNLVKDKNVVGEFRLWKTLPSLHKKDENRQRTATG